MYNKKSLENNNKNLISFFLNYLNIIYFNDFEKANQFHNACIIIGNLSNTHSKNHNQI